MSAPAIDPLLSFEVNGMRPFDTSPADLAATSLEQAHGLAIMLGSAFHESEDFRTTNANIIRAGFEGIARLIALAAFAGKSQ